MKTISQPPVSRLLNRVWFALFCATACWFATTFLTSCQETLSELPDKTFDRDRSSLNAQNEDFLIEADGISLADYEAVKVDEPIIFDVAVDPCSRVGADLKVIIKNDRKYSFNWEVDGHFVSNKATVPCVSGKTATISVTRESDQLTVSKKVPVTRIFNPKHPFNFAIIKSNCAGNTASVAVGITNPQNYTYAWTLDGKDAGTSSVLECTCGLAAEVTVTRKSDGKQSRRLVFLPACSDNSCGFANTGKKAGIPAAAFVVNAEVTSCFAGGATIQLHTDDSETYNYVWEINDKVAGKTPKVTCICGSYAKVRVTRKCDGATVFRTFDIPQCIDQ